MKHSQSDIEARLEEIRRSFVESLHDKRQTLQSGWSTLSKEWNDETYSELFMVLHGLAGSAETFGFAEISADARILVEQLRPLANAGTAAKSASTVAGLDTDFQRLLASLNLALSA